MLCLFSHKLNERLCGLNPQLAFFRSQCRTVQVYLPRKDHLLEIADVANGNWMARNATRMATRSNGCRRQAHPALPYQHWDVRMDHRQRTFGRTKRKRPGWRGCRARREWKWSRSGRMMLQGLIGVHEAARGMRAQCPTRLVAVIIVPVGTWSAVWWPIHSAHLQKAAKKPSYSSQGGSSWLRARSKQVGHGEPSIYDLPSWVSLYLNTQTRNRAIWGTPCGILVQDVDMNQGEGYGKINAGRQIKGSV
jgi:hypothetical protein